MRHQLEKTTILIISTIILTTMIVPACSTVSWSEHMTRLTTDLSEDSSPSITQMMDGRVWIVWEKGVLGNFVLFYKDSYDLGTTWSEEKNITQVLAPGLNTNPSIIQAANGTIWVVWAASKPPPPSPDFSMKASPSFLSIPQSGSDTSNITVTSIDDFNDPVNLTVSGEPEDVTATLTPTQVTPPPNGSVNSTLTISVGPIATPGIYMMTVTGESGSLIHNIKIVLEVTEAGTLGSTSTSPHTQVEEDPPEEGGDEDYEIFYKISNDYGSLWSNDTQLTDNSVDDLNPSVIQTANGTICIVWCSDKTGNDEIFCKAYNGTSWSNGIQLTTDPETDVGPSVMQAKDGKVWVVWSSRRTGDYEIFYKTYNGTSWSNDTQLTYDEAKSDSSPAVLQTLDDAIYVFWNSRGTSPTATGDIYYMYSYNDGETWSDSIQFTTDSNEDLWPSLTQTGDCKIWVVWTSNRGDQPDGNWDIYYRTSLSADINEDGIVDIVDLSIVGHAYGAFKGEPNYNPDADINKDGIVDIGDITIVCISYGDT